MKVLAMYLPQFHRIKENDEWWGEGFTEWTTVKAAKPLYEGHVQPVVPYENNYYDLLDKNTMQWQADLMRQYGVDGVCMYHYWFKDGKKLLEKPAENLLQWTDIDMPFCFCWASTSWKRTWSKVAGDVWAKSYETDNDKKETEGVLAEQRYGLKKDWKEHFDYLLPFFKDERYIKIEGKPVFVLLHTSLISCFENMVDYWQSLAKQAGLSGLFLVGACCDRNQEQYLDLELIHQPGTALSMCSCELAGARVANYDEVWNCILEQPIKVGQSMEGVVSFDATPRHGSDGIVLKGASPVKFGHYFSGLLAKNAAANSPITFLNAWNEWGEGMCLEPDKIFEYGYLDAFSRAKEAYEKDINRDIGGREDIQDTGKKIDRNAHLVRVFDAWMTAREKKENLASIISKMGINKIAIYGYGLLGKHFFEELRGSGIVIKYIIDKNKEGIYAEVPVYLPEEKLPEVELIVVTATFAYGSIYKLLKEKGISSEVISLEHIIMEAN